MATSTDVPSAAAYRPPTVEALAAGSARSQSTSSTSTPYPHPSSAPPISSWV